MAPGTFLTFNPSNKDGAELNEICEEHGKNADVMKEIDAAEVPVNKNNDNEKINNDNKTVNENKNKLDNEKNNNKIDDDSSSLPLQHKWYIWEQIIPEGVKPNQRAERYSENTKELAHFDTVQKFWQLWYHMPQPSELLNQKRMVREGQDGKQHIVDALMIFRDKVKPEWEDPVNCEGGHFEFKLKQSEITSGSQVDEYWNNLVLGLIGSTIEYNHLITGVRLVDKLSNVRYGTIRIEVWFSKCSNENTLDELRKSIEKCICTKLDGSMGTIPNCIKRMHCERLK